MLERTNAHQEAIQKGPGNRGIARRNTKRFFGRPLEKLYRKCPMEPVSRFQHFESRLANQWKKSSFGVTGEVMVDGVVIGPHQFVRRDRENQIPIILQKRGHPMQRRLRILQVFQDIEHEDNVIAFARLKGCVKWAEGNSFAMGIVLGNQVPVGLQTFDTAKVGELIEEQSVPTSDVEDFAHASARRCAANSLKYPALAHAPPPMRFV